MKKRDSLKNDELRNDVIVIIIRYWDVYRQIFRSFVKDFRYRIILLILNISYLLLSFEKY